MNSNTHNSQIFIQAPDLQIPIQTLTLTPNFTIHNLKQLFFKTKSYPLALTSSSYFTLNGRILPDNGTVKTTGIQGLETLTLNLRIYGGGGDGGSTCAESRDCYLNMYAEKKPDKVDPNEQRLSKWLNCAISNEALRKPIVVDYLGNLFNKECLVSALLEKKIPKAFSHIKRLRDVIDVEMEVIPGSGDGLDRSDKDVKFQCPVTGLEFNGKYKFYALKSCGHVLSVKALREIKTNSCHVCRKEFVESDKIVINGNEEEVNALRESLNLREKKVKKVKNGGDGVEVVKVSGTKRGSELKAEKVNGKIETSGKGVKGAEVNGKSEGKRFKAGDMAPPNATKDVYASIFTSSRKSDFKETYSCRSLPLGRN
ncbi:protein RTF2 [Tanacetum coccineum]